jgi:hypothetical protein
MIQQNMVSVIKIMILQIIFLWNVFIVRKSRLGIYLVLCQLGLDAIVPTSVCVYGNNGI